jgi:hypothetical protein
MQVLLTLVLLNGVLDALIGEHLVQQIPRLVQQRVEVPTGELDDLRPSLDAEGLAQGMAFLRWPFLERPLGAFIDDGVAQDLL